MIVAESAPRVSMSTFLDYIVAAGPGRLRLVARQVEQYAEAYNPASDYYRPMLIALKADLRMGTGSQHLDEAVRSARGSRTLHFPAVRNGLAQYVKRAQKTSARLNNARSKEWVQAEVRVNVNPDYILEDSEGGSATVKVYFKAPELNRFTANAAVRLMQLAAVVGQESVPYILDARRGKLYRPAAKLPGGLDQYLESEALAFGRLWQGIAA